MKKQQFTADPGLDRELEAELASFREEELPTGVLERARDMASSLAFSSISL